MKTVFNFGIFLFLGVLGAIMALASLRDPGDIKFLALVVIAMGVLIILLILTLARVAIGLFDKYQSLSPEEKEKADLFKWYSELPPEKQGNIKKYGKKAIRVVADRLKEGPHKRTVEDAEKILRED